MGYYDRPIKTAERFQDEAAQFRGRTSRIDVGISPQDQQMFDQSFGHYRDLVLQSLQQDLPGILEQSGGQVGVRGLGGQEAQAYIQNANAQIRGNQAAQQIGQFGAMQAGQMAGFAGNRAQLQLQRNQQLWQQLVQPYQTMIGLQEGQARERIEKNKSDWQALGGIIGAGASIITGGL